MSIFLYVVIAILQTHASLISEDLSQVISSIFSMSPPGQQLKLKFSMSVVILLVGVQGSITDNYNASDDAALLVSSSSSSSAFSLGHRTSECATKSHDRP